VTGVRIDPDHWFKRFYVWFFPFVRVECRCGWKTWPHLSMDAAAHEFVLHQVATGEPSC
jgi:hypothetical protein